MQSHPSSRFKPYIESVEHIIAAMKLKERHIEELNTSDFSDDSENIRKKVLAFEALFASVKESNISDQDAMRLTDSQKRVCEKVIEEANLGIESHNLKVVRDSIRDLKSFRERITSS